MTDDRELRESMEFDWPGDAAAAVPPEHGDRVYPIADADRSADSMSDEAAMSALMEFFGAVVQESEQIDTVAVSVPRPARNADRDAAAFSKPADAPTADAAIALGQDTTLDLGWDVQGEIEFVGGWPSAGNDPDDPETEGSGTTDGAAEHVQRSWLVESQPIPPAIAPGALTLDDRVSPGDRTDHPDPSPAPLRIELPPPPALEFTPTEGAPVHPVLREPSSTPAPPTRPGPASNNPSPPINPDDGRKGQRSPVERRPLPLQGLGAIAITAMMVGMALWFAGGPKRTFIWQTERDIDRALAKTPELAVYRINASVRGSLLQLTGRVPSADIRDRAVEVARQIAPELEVDNDILVLAVPPAPGQVAADATRLAAAISQQPDTTISAAVQGDLAILTGDAFDTVDLDEIAAQFTKIPGIERVTNRIAVRPLTVPQRIYFGGQSDLVPAPDLRNKLVPVAELLQRYPQYRIAAIGYSHPIENDPTLGRRRAQSVRNSLENLGIDRTRVEIQTPSGLPPGLNDGDLPWLSQCALFQLIPPAVTDTPPAPSEPSG